MKALFAAEQYGKVVHLAAQAGFAIPWRTHTPILTAILSAHCGVTGRRLTEKLDSEETLFIVCSKTFTTQETRVDPNAASDWLSNVLGDDAVSHHFAAASTNHEAMDAFGINPD